ncbi:hypothetical protein ACHAPT_008305, partial [Fusarium lateritium]
YYEAPAVSFYIDNRLGARQLESEVRKTWLTLLGHVFPAAEGYGLNAEAPTANGRIDIDVAEIVFCGKREENIFFVVECKRPSDERTK